MGDADDVTLAGEAAPVAAAVALADPALELEPALVLVAAALEAVLDDDVVELLVALLPQAANKPPSSGAETPSRPARRRKTRRVIRDCRGLVPLVLLGSD